MASDPQFFDKAGKRPYGVSRGSRSCARRLVLHLLSLSPLGPRVVLTRSAMAMAPTKELRRALSPLSTWALSLSTAYGGETETDRGGARERDSVRITLLVPQPLCA